MTSGPTLFEVHESGVLLHGTKADLAVGDLLGPGRLSNFDEGREMNHIYVMEPLGALEDDPNLTARSSPATRPVPAAARGRSRSSVSSWIGSGTSEQVQAMRDGSGRSRAPGTRGPRGLGSSPASDPSTAPGLPVGRSGQPLSLHDVSIGLCRASRSLSVAAGRRRGRGRIPGN